MPGLSKEVSPESNSGSKLIPCVTSTFKNLIWSFLSLSLYILNNDYVKYVSTSCMPLPLQEDDNITHCQSRLETKLSPFEIWLTFYSNFLNISQLHWFIESFSWLVIHGITFRGNFLYTLLRSSFFQFVDEYSIHIQLNIFMPLQKYSPNSIFCIQIYLGSHTIKLFHVISKGLPKQFIVFRYTLVHIQSNIFMPFQKDSLNTIYCI